jgi:hypothetical protein
MGKIKFGGSVDTQNPYLAKDREKYEREAERKKRTERLYESISDICGEINSSAYSLKAIDSEDENNVMRVCRNIEDYIGDIRRKYGEIEKLKYSGDN